MSYKIIEITSEKKSELMEHAEKAYEHIGKMLDCIDEIGQGQMGQREGDGWYVRPLNREYGYSRDNEGRWDMGERHNRRMGMRYGMGYRDEYPYYSRPY